MSTALASHPASRIDPSSIAPLSWRMHPFTRGRYPGSGPARAVIAEAGLDGESQFRRISDYVQALRHAVTPR